MKPLITISLVNYKTPELLVECIASIYKYTKKFPFEIIVADNNSEDESIMLVRKLYPEVTVIANKKNLYATGGNNQVFKKAKGKYFLVLNPDMLFKTDAISQMAQFLEDHQFIAAVSCRQTRKNGELEYVCCEFSNPYIEFMENNLLGRFFRNEKILSKFRYKGWERDTIRIVDVIPDTIMLIRTDIAKTLKLYDEKIKLMYMENDLCKRIKALGYSVCYLGNVNVTHYRGESVKKLPSKEFYYITESDMLYYYEKYFGKVWRDILYVLFQVNRTYYFFEPVISFVRRRNI